MRNESTEAEKAAFARGWKLARVSPRVRAWFKEPPVNQAAAIYFFATAGLAALIVWLTWIFLTALHHLSQLAYQGELKEQAEAARHLVTASGAILGGAIATILVIWRTWLTQRQTKTAEEQRHISEQTHYTTLFTKAVEQLGTTKEEKYKDKNTETVKTVPNLPVRLGAIYALERIARDSARDHWPIMETLCSYIRENSPATTEHNSELKRSIQIDIQAAISVIERRSNIQKLSETPNQKLNLRRTMLNSADFSRLDFSNADLSESEIDNSLFIESDISGVDFVNSSLESAHFQFTNMENAQCMNANLKKASMNRSNLSEAQFWDADLSGASLYESKLVDAHFIDTNLYGVNFRDTDLSKARFLTQDQINFAIGNKNTTLPNNIKMPEEWEKEDDIPF